ncbi:hypothetical protein PanNE5_14110 [Pandoraea sp. NE5]|nr:hypothetical protein PanNE5_14110 [Pandoraea sp. NE5]
MIHHLLFYSNAPSCLNNGYLITYRHGTKRTFEHVAPLNSEVAQNGARINEPNSAGGQFRKKNFGRMCGDVSSKRFSQTYGIDKLLVLGAYGCDTTHHAI